MAKLSKKEARVRRHRRLRRTVSGTAETPRMSVCLTSKHIYVQLIDDLAGKTLVAISTLDPEYRKEGPKTATMTAAEKLGTLAAKRAVAADIKAVVFDRGGFRYHGRVKAIAEAARKAGLTF